MKIRMGFRWFSPPGEMPPLLFGGKAGTVMTGFASHYIIKRRGKQNFFPVKSARVIQPMALDCFLEGFFKGQVVPIVGGKAKNRHINFVHPKHKAVFPGFGLDGDSVGASGHGDKIYFCIGFLQLQLL